MKAKKGGQGSPHHWPQAKACAATCRENTHTKRIVVTGQSIYQLGSLRMENSITNAHHSHCYE